MRNEPDTPRPPVPAPTRRRAWKRQRLRGWRRWLTLGFGWTFLVLGVLGLFLPILQGVLFLLIGLFILGQHQPWARRLLRRVERRFPRAAAKVHEARERADGWLGRLRAGLGRTARVL
jgi:uncharacterized protein